MWYVNNNQSDFKRDVVDVKESAESKIVGFKQQLKDVNVTVN